MLQLKHMLVRRSGTCKYCSSRVVASAHQMSSRSKIFAGFRALGFTSNHVPLVTRYHERHKENYVTTCVGKSFHTYNCSKLGITSVSDAHPDQIECIAVDGRYVFTACKNQIQAFSRGRKAVHTYEGHDADVHLLLTFGHHLISVDSNSTLCVWDVESEEVYLELHFENTSFQISSIVHPSTYLNKVLLGSQQGSMQLWNCHSNKLLFTFYGWGAAITTLEQAPAVDVIAIGLSDGQIILHNIRFDETVLKLRQDWGPVTGISFRTDGHPVMVTGSSVGHIALWDLDKRRLQSQMRDAHTGAVTGLKCLPSEPLLVTSSSDNSLKVWIFDQPDGGGRLLRHRAGHSAPPNKVKYHGSSGQNILSAGQDSTLRSFSTVHDSANKSLGRASYNKSKSRKTGLKLDEHKMPPIIDFASETSRESDWDGILACHRGDPTVTTWNYQKSTMGAHKLVPERQTKITSLTTTALPQCVALSSCGNFGLVGYSSGHVDLFNMQSGLHRGSYGNPTAHRGPVRGVAIDALNQVVVSSGADNCVRLWKFKSKVLLEEIVVESQASRLLLHKDSAMLAVVLDNFKVIIIDVDTRRIVRKFTGHGGIITGLTFSPDGRWLLTASMDSTVRTWDLPTARLVDCFAVDAAVTSLSLSPVGDFLVTTHVDDVGVYLWSNMTLYTHVALRPLPADFEPVLIDMPTTGRLSHDDAEEQTEEEEEEEFPSYHTPDQISDQLVTLSLLPNSRWQNLLNLDVIKQRNKPKEPPKVPKAAPFFLPTVAGLQPKFGQEKTGDDKSDGSSRVLKSSLQLLTEFGRAVEKAETSEHYFDLLKRLKEMGPSAVDLELRSLAPDVGGSITLLINFLDFMKHILITNTDFEIIQAYLGLFLKLHSELLSTEPKLVAAITELQDTQVSAWHRLQTLCNQNLCLVTYMRSAVF